MKLSKILIVLGAVVFLCGLIIFGIYRFGGQRSDFLVTPIFGRSIASELGKGIISANLPLNGIPQETQNAVVASFSGQVPTQIFFDRNRDISQSVRALQIIWERAKIEGRIPKEIDLRFEKAVIRY